MSSSKPRILVTTVLAASFSFAFAGARAQETFAYPPAGRTESQQRQDQYECHQWAVEQSHFDPVQYAAQTPSQPTVDAQRQQAARAQSGSVAGSALKGAVIAEAADEDAGDGARAGAALGLLRQRRAQGAAAVERAQSQQQMQQQQAQQAKELQAKQQAYQRARSTCYKARGYTLSDA